MVKHFEAAKQKGDKVAGQPIRDLVTVNGVRVTVEDGTWGLVRASSNKPELVVVVESPASEARMREMFKAVDARAAHASRSRRVQPDDLRHAARFGLPAAIGGHIRLSKYRCSFEPWRRCCDRLQRYHRS